MSSNVVATVNEEVVTSKGEKHRPTVVSEQTGIQTIKGSQTGQENFIDACVASYTNLSNAPSIAMAYSFLVVTALAESNNKSGPLELIAETVKSLVDNPEINPLLKGFAGLIQSLVTHIIPVKVIFIGVSLMWVPYFAKPSSKNIRFSIGLTVLVFLRPTTGLLSDVFLSNLYFLYTQVRNPQHKFFVLCILIFTGIYGLSTVNKIVAPVNEPTRTFRAVHDTPPAYQEQHRSSERPPVLKNAKPTSVPLYKGNPDIASPNSRTS